METNYAEEQATEIESLESIYPESFRLDKDDPKRKFSIEIVPHPDTDEPNYVGVMLHVKYPEKYPDEVAHLEIERLKGLTIPQMKEITQLAIQTANDNLGLACMFQIISELQEYLVQNNIPGDTSFHDQIKAQKELDARLKRLQFGSEDKTDDHSALDVHSIQDFDKSYQRKRGTPVTVESFNEWQKKFITKYREDQQILREKLYGNDSNREQLTGKEIFEEMAKEQLGSFAQFNENNDNGDENMIDENNNELETKLNEMNDDTSENDNKKKKKRKKKKKSDKNEKLIVVGDKNSDNNGNSKNDTSDNKNKNKNDNDENTVYVDDASLFLMDMPDA